MSRQRYSPLQPPFLADAVSGADRAVLYDLRDYLPHLDGTNLSEPEKLELLQTLWPIMLAFVDLAFGVSLHTKQALPSVASGSDIESTLQPRRNQREVQ